jgi:hypothetical protein
MRARSGGPAQVVVERSLPYQGLRLCWRAVEAIVQALSRRSQDEAREVPTAAALNPRKPAGRASK